MSTPEHSRETPRDSDYLARYAPRGLDGVSSRYATRGLDGTRRRCTRLPQGGREGHRSEARRERIFITALQLRRGTPLHPQDGSSQSAGACLVLSQWRAGASSRRRRKSPLRSARPAVAAWARSARGQRSKAVPASVGMMLPREWGCSSRPRVRAWPMKA